MVAVAKERVVFMHLTAGTEAAPCHTCSACNVIFTAAPFKPCKQIDRRECSCRSTWGIQNTYDNQIVLPYLQCEVQVEHVIAGG
jgi:hypothetical protein